MFERSAYSRPLTLRLLSAKLSLPTTRIFPSVEIAIVTWPLNSCLRGVDRVDGRRADDRHRRA